MIGPVAGESVHEWAPAVAAFTWSDPLCCVAALWRVTRSAVLLLCGVWCRNHRYLKIPITLLGLIAGVGWPQLLHSGFYATGTPFMYWWTIPYMGMVWGVGLAGGIGERGRNILDDYDLVRIIAPALACCSSPFLFPTE